MTCELEKTDKSESAWKAQYLWGLVALKTFGCDT